MSDLLFWSWSFSSELYMFTGAHLVVRVWPCVIRGNDEHDTDFDDVNYDDNVVVVVVVVVG